MKTRHARTNERGSVLILSVVILVLVTVVALSTMGVVQTQHEVALEAHKFTVVRMGIMSGEANAIYALEDHYVNDPVTHLGQDWNTQFLENAGNNPGIVPAEVWRDEQAYRDLAVGEPAAAMPTDARNIWGSDPGISDDVINDVSIVDGSIVQRTPFDGGYTVHNGHADYKVLCYYDHEYKPVIEADARYALRYAVGIIDQSGLLLANKALNLDGDRIATDHSGPTGTAHHLLLAGFGFPDYGPSWPNNGPITFTDGINEVSGPIKYDKAIGGDDKTYVPIERTGGTVPSVWRKMGYYDVKSYAYPFSDRFKNYFDPNNGAEVRTIIDNAIAAESPPTRYFNMSNSTQYAGVTEQMLRPLLFQAELFNWGQLGQTMYGIDPSGTAKGSGALDDEAENQIKKASLETSKLQCWTPFSTQIGWVNDADVELYNWTVNVNTAPLRTIQGMMRAVDSLKEQTDPNHISLSEGDTNILVWNAGAGKVEVKPTEEFILLHRWPQYGGERPTVDNTVLLSNGKTYRYTMPVMKEAPVLNMQDLKDGLTIEFWEEAAGVPVAGTEETWVDPRVEELAGGYMGMKLVIESDQVVGTKKIGSRYFRVAVRCQLFDIDRREVAKEQGYQFVYHIDPDRDGNCRDSTYLYSDVENPSVQHGNTFF